MLELDFKDISNDDIRKEYESYIEKYKQKLEVFIPMFEEVSTMKEQIQEIVVELFKRGMITSEDKKKIIGSDSSDGEKKTNE